MKNLAYKIDNDSYNITDFNQNNNVFSIETIEAETIDAYEQIAHEYDGNEHNTTRILENLSNESFRNMLNNYPDIQGKSNVLEIGSGAGSLSKFILKTLSLTAKLTFLDSSVSMLDLLRSRIIETNYNLSFINGSIFSNCLNELLGKYDMFYCGLCDPYLIEPALVNIRNLSCINSYIFLTIPGDKWALKERKERLHIPYYKTRFTLKNGKSFYPYSFTYEFDELNSLLFNSKFKVIDRWVTSYKPIVFDINFSKNPPFVDSILAKAI